MNNDEHETRTTNDGIQLFNISQARRPDRGYKAQKDQELFDEIRKEAIDKKKKKTFGRNVLSAIAITGVAIGIISFSISQLNEMNQGSHDPEKYGEIDPKITSITLTDKVNARHDPFYSGQGENLIEQIDPKEPLKISTPNGVYVTYYKNDEYLPNGLYYGVKTEDIQESIPNFDDNGDNDKIVWFNQDSATVEEADN